MGIALADASAEYGASVTLVLGPVNVRPNNPSINIVSVTTAESMAEKCISLFPECDIAILSAAVADFTPSVTKDRKIKKADNELVITLKPTSDIAMLLGKMKKASQFLAGFALETDNEIENARGKLARKNLDMVVLNSLNEEGAGFGYDTNRITIIDRNNNIDKFELKSKEEAAKDILAKIVSMTQ
jgi:phosphopantothenoylcysteine decarboxylase / phosphopantothenate---cysteine ligase